jgi:hypothetical protein
MLTLRNEVPEGIEFWRMVVSDERWREVVINGKSRVIGLIVSGHS